MQTRGRDLAGSLVVVAVFLFFLAAGGAAQEPQPGGTLRVGLQGDVTTMDPHMSTAALDRDVYYQLYNTLVGLDPNLNIVPELAASWATSSPSTCSTPTPSGST